MSAARNIITPRSPPPGISAESLLSVSTPSVAEGDVGTVVLRFVMARTSDGYPSMQYSAVTTAGGTATPGVDFYPYTQSGSIIAGQTINLDVLVIGDAIPESNETVQMVVTAAWP